MKKLIYLLMIAAVLVSCKKNTTNEVTPQDEMQEVQFNVTSILNSTDRELEIPICNTNLNADYAEFVIDGTTYFAGVYYIGDSLYTKALMMAPGGPYFVTEFYLWDDQGTDLNYLGIPGDLGNPTVTARSDDLLYKAAPMPGSDYYEFADNKLDREFWVTKFLKTKIYIDVLCYVPHTYQYFGFFWFNITEITIREMCFFGDICLKSLSDYDGSWYENQENRLQIDMPAIFMIKVYHQREGHAEVYVGSFNNEYFDPPTNLLPWWGEGAPLCFKYADYDADIDHYWFELWIYVADGDDPSGFGYVHFETWEFDDEVPADLVGTDGVVDFVLGECMHDPGDDVEVLTPYMNLPETATLAHGTSSTGAYFGVTFSAFTPNSSGYDIAIGPEYPAWCGDGFHYVNPSPYTADVYSTMDDLDADPNFPVDYIDNRKAECLNFLFNNFAMNGVDVLTNDYDNVETDQIQQSVWSTIHGVPNGTIHMPPNAAFNPATYPGSDWQGPSSFRSDVLGFSTEALGSSSVAYLPPPGGFAGIMLVQLINDEYAGQLLILIVDP